MSAISRQTATQASTMNVNRFLRNIYCSSRNQYGTGSYPLSDRPSRIASRSPFDDASFIGPERKTRNRRRYDTLQIPGTEVGGILGMAEIDIRGESRYLLNR